MNQKRRIYFLPKTKLGKISFWLVILGILLIYIPYWLAIGLNISIPIPASFLALGLISIFGICSIISIFKYKERAIGLFISSLIGLLGILFVLAELIIGHD